VVRTSAATWLDLVLRRAPYFKELLLNRVKASGEVVVMFDESLNTVTKRKQMDVHVRSWIDGQVISRYLTSQLACGIWRIC